MAKDVKLNSSDWCDLVFQGKNKSYGAYALRQSSSKRHLIAFGAIILFVGAVSALPSFWDKIKPEERLGGTTEANVISIIEQQEEEPKDEIIQREVTPPPPELRRAEISFTPPVIVETVDENREMRSQTELNENRSLQISVVDNLNGSTDPNAIPTELITEHRQVVEEPTTVFESVEQMPKFPGGDTELMRFISSNMKYPPIAAENGIEGRVVLRFVVDKTGKVSDISILRSIDPSLDKEAMRVVKSMPKWIPGMQNGRAVSVYYTLPVLFKLQK